jgi:hypothetical protein
LDKYSWNIECVPYIMDLLHIHLKELLEAIAQAHTQQQQQYSQQLHHLQQQQHNLQHQYQKQLQQIERNLAENTISTNSGNQNGGCFISNGTTPTVSHNNYLNGAVSTGLLTTASININHSNNSIPNATVQSNNLQSQHHHHHHHHQFNQPLQSITSSLNNHIQQQLQHTQLIGKLNELIATLIKVNFSRTFKTIFIFNQF